MTPAPSPGRITSPRSNHSILSRSTNQGTPPIIIAYPSSDHRRRRLLLGEAVERPQAEDKIDGVDPDDLTARKEPCQGLERDTVGRIVEDRDQDEAVGDVEIG